MEFVAFGHRIGPADVDLHCRRDHPKTSAGQWEVTDANAEADVTACVLEADRVATTVARAIQAPKLRVAAALEQHDLKRRTKRAAEVRHAAELHDEPPLRCGADRLMAYVAAGARIEVIPEPREQPVRRTRARGLSTGTTPVGLTGDEGDEAVRADEGVRPANTIKEVWKADAHRRRCLIVAERDRRPRRADVVPDPSRGRRPTVTGIVGTTAIRHDDHPLLRNRAAVAVVDADADIEPPGGDRGPSDNAGRGVDRHTDRALFEGPNQRIRGPTGIARVGIVSVQLTDARGRRRAGRDGRRSVADRVAGAVPNGQPIAPGGLAVAESQVGLRTVVTDDIELRDCTKALDRTIGAAGPSEHAPVAS